MLNELMRRILFLPPQASTVAGHVDHLHYFVIIITMLGATGVGLVGGIFLLRYRRSRVATLQPEQGPHGGPHGASARFEIGIVIALFGLFVFWWWIGFHQYTRMRVAPENSLRIYVTAKQWMWKFADPAGNHEIAQLVVPAGRPIQLVMTARDVIHSFYVPDFRIKQDVLPGRYTTVWFEADQPGVHQILCTEYCGTGHSMMRGEVVVLAPEDYGRWLARRPPVASLRPAGPTDIDPAVVEKFSPAEPLSMAQLGERISAEQGCLRCHSVDGTPYIGPTWAGLYNASVPLTDGTTVIADPAYLTESMMDPLRKLHAGFQPVMPSYQGRLKPGEPAAIVEYIRVLSSTPAQGVAPVIPPAPQPVAPLGYRPEESK